MSTRPHDTPADTPPDVESAILDHWPYAAELCKSRLDLDRFEAHAERILARGLRTQRLVAFVGAGSSLTYGRFSWRGLMRALYGDLQTAAAGPKTSAQARDVWDRVNQRLWGSSVDEFLDHPDHVLKCQVLSDLMDLLLPIETPAEVGGQVSDVEPAPVPPLKVKTQNRLKDTKGFIESLLNHCEQDARVAADWRADAGDGLPSVLRALASIQETAGGEAVLLKDALRTALKSKSQRFDSPLRLLILEWGVRRFITTNYDNEIEEALHLYNFSKLAGKQGPQAHANHIETIGFGRRESAKALRFAVEGPRRHAAVFHLHGDVNDAASIIVTESDYQRLYLDDHPLRDLVTNATQANFSANPILFVGSDVSEEDVLRPLRQFMSGAGHRRDRMIVALFVANRSAAKREKRRVELLLKYGVYAVYAGRVQVKGEPGIDTEWLNRLVDLQDQWTGANAAKPKPDAGAMAQAIKDLGIPEVIESLSLRNHPELEMHEPLAQLTGAFSALAALAARTDSASSSDVFDRSRRRVSALFDVTVTWVSSCILSAKLITLRQRALDLQLLDSTLALPYRRRADQAKATLDPDTEEPEFPWLVLRHSVVIGDGVQAGRFARIGTRLRAGPATQNAAERLPFDEGIGQLLADIRKYGEFAMPDGLRLIVVCAARGTGKGAQFDRLVARTDTAPPPSGREQPSFGYLVRLAQALGHRRDGQGRFDTVVLHVNLSFTNELGPLISQWSAALWLAAGQPMPHSRDQMELFERGLKALGTGDGPSGRRLLLLLGNAGVLFDEDGRPKNGQIQRLMALLMAPEHRRCRLDVVVYVGESQMPAGLRRPALEAAQRLEKDAAAARAEGTTAASTPPPAPVVAAPPPSFDSNLRPARRMDRLNLAHGLVRKRVLVHVLVASRVIDVAAAYFPDLAYALGWAHLPGDTPYEGQWEARAPDTPDALARALHVATGGSRFAQTLILAQLDALLSASGMHRGADSPVIPDGLGESLRRELRAILGVLNGPPSGSVVETAIESVLDRWAHWHLLGQPMAPGIATGPQTGTASDLPAGGAPGWNLVYELLWHLAAMSLPVESGVLASCPRINSAAQALCQAPGSEEQRVAIIDQMLERMTGWCLVFPVDRRPLPGDLPVPRASRRRYALHRHMQRHMLRRMGGRNVESTQWDHYTTSIYASLPDELPGLQPWVHHALVGVIQQLTAFPVRQAPGAEPTAAAAFGAAQQAVLAGDAAKAQRILVEQADRIRAAYFVIRSTYSLGVIAHLEPDDEADATRLGHLELHRQLVRWTTHAALYWERAAKTVREVAPDFWRAPDTEPKRPMGIFFPGELVWLYNECGVISLAQGKLHDAEHLLTLAEQAARLAEADDAGSMHTRIRIHTALVQIERGRPHRARRILLPIAERIHGNAIPPLLALSSLALIEHLGGNYSLALRHYNSALEGLNTRKRSRAAALARMGMAEVMNRVQGHGGLEAALLEADAAIGLAQQGGHEDVRVLATLARVRICIEAQSVQGRSLFALLSFAEQYGTRMDIPRIVCEARELRARILLHQGELHLSAADASASVEIAAKYDLKLKKARSLLTLAQIYRERGELAGARDLCETGGAIAVSCEYATCVRGFNELALALGVATS